MRMRARLPFLLLGFILGTISIGVVYAWTGPTQSPPGGNVAAPVNVGAIDQVKDAGLSLNSLAVFGSQYVSGNIGIKTESPVVPLHVAGTIKIGYSNELCQEISAGALRWNASSQTIDFCDGTAWQALSTTTAPPAPTVTPETYTYTTPGTHVFAVVPYNTMRVRVWGGGGGGSVGNIEAEGGSAGGTSSFNYALYAYGGGGGVGEYSPGSGGGWSGGSGANGTAASCSGSDKEWGGGGGCSPGRGGNSPNGGAGGSAGGGSGGAPGGGGGGSIYWGYGGSGAGGGGGGYTEYTYSAGDFTAGALVTVIVGSGGSGMRIPITPWQSQNVFGGNGSGGRVEIIVK